MTILKFGIVLAIFTGAVVSYVDQQNDQRSLDLRHPEDGGQREECQKPPRVFTFGIGRNFPPLEKLDEEKMQVVGLGVDIVNAACRVANQHCEIVVYSNYSQCWLDNQAFSEALSNNWFDACVGYHATEERKLVYKFTQPFTRARAIALYVRNSDAISIQDLLRDGNDISIGFRRDIWVNPRCLRGNGVRVNENRIRMFDDFESLLEALRMGEVRVAFSEVQNVDQNILQELNLEGRTLSCNQGGNSIMMRKDNIELFNWLNHAIEEVMHSDAYPRMCYTWERIFERRTNCFEMAPGRM